MSDFSIMQLWKQWVPGIENIDRRIQWCRICKEQLAAPFRDRCLKCNERIREEFEARIRRKRKSTGFSDYCIDCHSHERVWVASYERYCVEIQQTSYDDQLHCTVQYAVSLDGAMTCALCETCIEKMVSAPVYLSPNRVVWARNIHYIRKAIPEKRAV